VGYSSNVTVAGCRVDNASYQSEYCVWLWNSSGCCIDGKYLQGFICVQLNYSSNNVIHGNTLTGSGNQGSVGFTSSEGNLFYHNNFTGNYMGVLPDGVSSNFWDNGYPEGGNYWDGYVDRMGSMARDDYKGPDQDQPGADGIWDRAYPINDNNTDYYPMVPEYSTLIFLGALIFTTILVIVPIHRGRQNRPQKTRIESPPAIFIKQLFATRKNRATALFGCFGEFCKRTSVSVYLLNLLNFVSQRS